MSNSAFTPAVLTISNNGLFYKLNSYQAAWSKTAVFSVSTSSQLVVECSGRVYNIAASTAVTMVDAATAGRNYYIYIRTDGTLGAYLDTTTAPSGGRLLGGFHYAAGGNTSSEGKTTAQINAYSFWDLKWKPNCPDPRGMTLVANKFWSDIYFLSRTADANGLPLTSGYIPSSIYNANIADGETDSTTTPLIPRDFGGNGSTRYVKANWWNMAECLGSFGKRHPTYQEFSMLAYGTTEESSLGSDPITAGLSSGTYTSKWGVMQSTGCLWVWGQEWNSSGAALTAGWFDLDTSVARGQQYQDTNAALRAVLFGGSWVATSNCGSRASTWADAPSGSALTVSARGVCEHLILV